MALPFVSGICRLLTWYVSTSLPLGPKNNFLSLSLSPLILYLLLFPFADRSNPLPQLPVAPACNQPFAVASRSLSRSHPVSALVRFASLPDEILAAMALFNGEAPGCAAVALPNRAAGDGRHAQAALVGEQATERLADAGRCWQILAWLVDESKPTPSGFVR